MFAIARKLLLKYIKIIFVTSKILFFHSEQHAKQLESWKDGREPTSIAWINVSITDLNAPLIAVDVIRMQTNSFHSLPATSQQQQQQE